MSLYESPTISSLYDVPCYTGFNVGVEWELESVVDIHMSQFSDAIDVHEENSLRNLGKEIVTAGPVTARMAKKLHGEIFSGAVQFDKPEDACTERGSIHVHVNFSDRTERDVQRFIRYYFLLEPGFFALVNQSRQNNIYCVKLSATHMMALLKKYQSFGMICKDGRWHKYTALNVKPLTQFGTVEFRHLQITPSSEIFSTWLDTIERLYDVTMSTKAPTLIDKAFMKELYFDVFRGQILPDNESMENLMEDTLLVMQPDNIFLTTRIKALKG